MITTHCKSKVVSSAGPQTLGQRAWGNFGRGFPLTGTRGMKWLWPLLLQAMTMGELSLRPPLASFVEHSVKRRWTAVLITVFSYHPSCKYSWKVKHKRVVSTLLFPTRNQERTVQGVFATSLIVSLLVSQMRSSGQLFCTCVPGKHTVCAC